MARAPDELRSHSDSSRLYSAVLADVLDELGFRQQVLLGGIAPLENRSRLFGRVRTLAMQAVHSPPVSPYAVEMTAIDALQPGDALVIAMPPSSECAVWGELLSTAALAHGAAGVVIDGPTRDADKIVALGFPTFCRGTTPRDSKGRVDGQAFDAPVMIAGVRCEPGDLIFGDRDGVVAIPARLAQQVLEAAWTKVAGENLVRHELESGASVQAVFAKYGVL